MSNSADSPNPPFVPNYLLYLLAAASEAASEHFHAHVRTRGLRVPEWRVMACLIDTDGSMVTELARYAMIEQSRLTKIIIQMDTRGLVTRRSDPKDGRRVRVFLTPQGRALADELVADAKIDEQELLRSFQGGQGPEIKQTLRALIEHLEFSQSEPAQRKTADAES
ncbi:MAG: MarR family transcriptional regulator [Hoeflea sp.]|uniref:MarR family winged helix-turn-helix transcriptional regulator n=1 Tax=Hoeflea sp. TaxID=1940281 RepID=UPI000C112D40|nr:MarR family winged helix-turn-helix transcriptional regulator [Hoeflea sp.]PHR20031.1 MAG: MarR family transcriptional regulator [Hoeflea sp.]